MVANSNAQNHQRNESEKPVKLRKLQHEHVRRWEYFKEVFGNVSIMTERRPSPSLQTSNFWWPTAKIMVATAFYRVANALEQCRIRNRSAVGKLSRREIVHDLAFLLFFFVVFVFVFCFQRRQVSGGTLGGNRFCSYTFSLLFTLLLLFSVAYFFVTFSQ